MQVVAEVEEPPTDDVASKADAVVRSVEPVGHGSGSIRLSNADPLPWLSTRYQVDHAEHNQEVCAICLEGLAPRPQAALHWLWVRPASRSMTQMRKPDVQASPLWLFP